MRTSTANPSPSMTRIEVDAMENGVSKYIKTTVDIYFVLDHMACAYCPLLETYARAQCRKTGEYIINTKTTGMYCPLNIIGEEA